MKAEVVPIHGKDLFGQPASPELGGTLRQRFAMPPFTVFDAKSGPWLDCKRAWISKGIRSEMRRGVGGDNPPGNGETNYNKDVHKQKTILEKERKRTFTTEEAIEEPLKLGRIKSARKNLTYGGTETPPDRQHKHRSKKEVPTRGGLTYGIGISGYRYEDEEDPDDYQTSHFDPVLCEIIYRWHCPQGGLIFDPFSGCSVSGMVASWMNRKFVGTDICADQVEANRRVAEKLPEGLPRPEWIVGDARDKIPTIPKADLLWSCPPYFDLEAYSENPKDLSTMSWGDFCDAYYDIIKKCVERLNDDRFAVIVIGDVRDNDGFYYNLPGLTTRMFERAGMRYYNEAVLLTSIGSLSMRTTRQFVLSRKLGKAHQNVLFYVKGDSEKATDFATGMTKRERTELLDKMAQERANINKDWDDE